MNEQTERDIQDKTDKEQKLLWMAKSDSIPETVSLFYAVKLHAEIQKYKNTE